MTDTVNRDTLRSDASVGTWIWPVVSWFRWQLIEVVWHGFCLAGSRFGLARTVILEPMGTVPTRLVGEAGFIAWCLTCLLGEMPMGPGTQCSFGAACSIWATALNLDPPKKGFVQQASCRWDERQIRTSFIEYNQTAVLCCMYYHLENFLFSCLTKYMS